MTYNTGNPIPSTDPRDLDDNARAFDRFLLSASASEPDRLGAPRKTWHQMELDAEALVAPNVAALAAAVAAVNKGVYFSAVSPVAMSTYDLSAFVRGLGGSADATAFRASIQAAQRGTNSDITQLTGLTTPLSVAQGGTGTTSSTGTGAGVHAISPTITTPNVVGTTTNDNAVAGSAGEFVSSEVLAGAAIALTSGAAANVTSISLTAGDWDVFGTVFTAPAGTTTQSAIAAGINTVSAVLPTPPGKGARIALPYSAAAGSTIGTPVGRMRLSLAATTTVYLVIVSTFAVSTNAAYGFLGARRIR